MLEDLFWLIHDDYPAAKRHLLKYKGTRNPTDYWVIPPQVAAAFTKFQPRQQLVLIVRTNPPIFRIHASSREGLPTVRPLWDSKIKC